MLNGCQKALLPHLHRLLTVGFHGGATDQQLLEAFLDRRDPSAFAALVQRHGRMVLSVCRRVLHDVHDAEDAFQATFLVLVRKARSIQKRGTVGSWLYGVAYRVALQCRANAARRRKHEREAGESLPRQCSYEAANHDARPILDEEINRLPEKYRQPILLCYFEGKTYEEAARLLGWPAGTVSARLARGRNLLGNRLARRGLTVASASLFALLAESAASATVPAALLETTVQTVLGFAAGSATSGVSVRVLALTEGVVKAMVQQKLKSLAGIMLAVSVLGGGARMFCRLSDTGAASAAQVQPPNKLRGEGETSRDSPAAARPRAREKPDRLGPSPLAPAANGVRPPQTRIGLINMTRVLKASKKFQSIEADLHGQAQHAQQQLAALRTLLQKIKSQEQDPDADARQREQTAKRVRELQAEIEDQSTVASRTLAGKTGDACAKMYRQIEVAANRVAKRDGLELVMFYTDAVTEADFYNPSNVQRKMTLPGALMPMVVAPGMDITESIVEALDKTAVP